MSQKSGFMKLLDKLTHQLPRATPGKNFYPCVIVGSNLGGIFSTAFISKSHGKKETLQVFENTSTSPYPVRGAYEQFRIPKSKFFPSSKMSVHSSAANTELVGVEKYLPEENSILLKNGNKIGYKQLIIASGFIQDYDKIKGLDEAWKDFDTPVYTTEDHPSWEVFNYKYTRWLTNYHHGDAYFYIPKFPFKGEIGAYHFLQAHQTWKDYKKIGHLHPNAEFKIINANDKFCQFEPETDEFFKKMCEKEGIEVLYNTELTEINKDNRTLTTIDSDGGVGVKEFNNLYVIPPSKIDQTLVDAGLAHEGSNWKLDVDNVTLQNPKHSNIWGLGDCADLPITPTFFGGIHQAECLSYNVYNALKDLPIEVAYDGFSKSAVTTGRSKTQFSIYDYNGARQGNLLGAEGNVLSRLRYYGWNKSKAGAFDKYYSGKAKPLHTTLLGKKKKFNMLEKISVVPSEETEYVPTKN